MKNKALIPWLLLLLLACIWGSSFILMKRGMETADGKAIFSDTQVGAFRMTIAGFVMLPFGLFSLEKIKSKKDFFALLVVGSCGNFFPAFLFTYAETKLSSGLAGILNGFTPFFAIILGWLFLNKKATLQQVIGLSVAFIGMMLVVSFGSDKKTDTDFLHVGAIILATVFYGTSLNTIKHFLSEYKSWEITALSFTFMFTPAVLIALFLKVPHTLLTNPHGFEGFGYIVILAVFGTCLALVLFNRLIASKSVVFASSVTYLMPIVAVSMGVVFAKEQFVVWQLIGMFVVIGGVYFANKIKA
jgi:drug/metabolite transporter (DMT)-like permease